MAISNRLKKRANELKYWSDQEQAGRVVEGFIQGYVVKIWLQITATGVVENVHFTSKLSPEKLAFIDVLLEFCIGKDQKTLSELSIREIENYCRDENHLPAINDEVFLEESRKLLENVKNNVYNFSSLETKFDFDPAISAFRNYRLVDKIQILERLFDQKVRPVLKKDGGNLILEEVDDQVITVRFEGNCGSCPSSEHGTLDFIQKTLQENLFDQSLEVVTALKRYL